MDVPPSRNGRPSIRVRSRTGAWCGPAGGPNAADVPGEDEIASRVGCFVNAEGYANYRITMPGSRVSIGILGRTAKPVDLENFAWLGNQDVPGNPTLSGEAAVGG